MAKRFTTEEFIQKARKIHGDKYDYSLVDYKGSKYKVKIVCPKHGIFEQRASYHLGGGICLKCAHNNLLSNSKDFIKKAIKIHNGRYDYSLVQYINNRTKVKIICPIHGIFEQRPMNHLDGKGCTKCANKTPTIQQFIETARKIHGDKYDYSLVDYSRVTEMITIICRDHGKFIIRASKHLNEKVGCAKCAIDKLRKGQNEFIKAAKKIHGNKYDYSKVSYKRNSSKVTIICPLHGEFYQTPQSHLRGNGCGKCGLIRIRELMLSDTKTFIKKARKVHGMKYDYSLVNYKGNRIVVNIKCPTHGIFSQTPQCHLAGHGCPRCQISVSFSHEQLIQLIKIIYNDKIIINDRSSIRPFELDIYLPKVGLAIEFNGTYWHCKNTRKDRFYHQKKHLLCKEKDIRLIQIDEHLWKRKRRWFEKLIKDAIEGRPLVYDKSRDTILVDARYDDGTSLLKEGYRLVKLTKPYRFVVKRKYAVYDAGRYIYKKI